jgi:hypothetical protein
MGCTFLTVYDFLIVNCSIFSLVPDVMELGVEKLFKRFHSFSFDHVVFVHSLVKIS